MSGDTSGPRADPNRPRFTLEPWDPHAPLLARIWAMIREDYVANGLKPASDTANADEARQVAYAMERWKRTNETVPQITMRELEAAELLMERKKQENPNAANWPDATVA